MASRPSVDPLAESDESTIAQWRIRKLIQSLSKARGYVCNTIRKNCKKSRALDCVGRNFHSGRISRPVFAVEWPHTNPHSACLALFRS